MTAPRNAVPALVPNRDWKSALNALSNIAVIVASIAVVAAVLLDFRTAHRAAEQREGGISSLRVGVQAPKVPGVNYSAADRTLLLFLSAHCKFCAQAAPFYRDLAETSKAGKGRVVAVFAEAAADVDEFEVREGLRIEAVSGFPFRNFAISGTPTAVLLSREGRVLRSWLGAPNEQMQGQIRSALLSN